METGAIKSNYKKTYCDRVSMDKSSRGADAVAHVATSPTWNMAPATTPLLKLGKYQ